MAETYSKENQLETGILPATQKVTADPDQYQAEASLPVNVSAAGLSGAMLFSLFTADIIKEATLFTR